MATSSTALEQLPAALPVAPRPTTHRYALWTNDVETTSIWLNTLRDSTGLRVLQEGMPALLDLYAEFNIRSTFYFTGYIAKLFPDIVKMIQAAGHEVGSHGKSHLVTNAFDVMPLDRQARHLQESKDLLEQISGQRVVSFRAPALRVNFDTPKALAEAGFLTDSSVASQRFDFGLSFGAWKKMHWLRAPRMPYRTAEDNLFRKGTGPIVEVPISAMLFPYIGTTMRIFPTITAGVRGALAREAKRTGRPINFDIHPNEFIDESNETRTIERRTKNPIAYLLADVLRAQLKVKNLGPAAGPLYRKQLDYFHQRGFRAVNVIDYCREVGLIAEKDLHGILPMPALPTA